MSNSVTRWNPKAILPKHRAIMRFQIQGMTNLEIAERLEMTPQAVSYIVTSDLYKAALTQLQDKADDLTIETQIDVKKKIAELSVYSIQDIEKMLKSDGYNISPRLRAEMHWDILDRAGQREPEKEPDMANQDYATALQEAYARRKANLGPNSTTPTPLLPPVNEEVLQITGTLG